MQKVREGPSWEEREAERKVAYDAHRARNLRPFADAKQHGLQEHVDSAMQNIGIGGMGTTADTGHDTSELKDIIQQQQSNQAARGPQVAETVEPPDIGPSVEAPRPDFKLGDWVNQPVDFPVGVPLEAGDPGLAHPMFKQPVPGVGVIGPSEEASAQGRLEMAQMDI